MCKCTLGECMYTHVKCVLYALPASLCPRQEAPSAAGCGAETWSAHSGGTQHSRVLDTWARELHPAAEDLGTRGSQSFPVPKASPQGFDTQGEAAMAFAGWYVWDSMATLPIVRFLGHVNGDLKSKGRQVFIPGHLAVVTLYDTFIKKGLPRVPCLHNLPLRRDKGVSSRFSRRDPQEIQSLTSSM